jgi:hypothetical protein
MSQTLSQSQIIRSLGQALDWFETEIGWGVAPADLNHLTGRIGELYAAMVTRGQMALATNQRGYDVVSIDGERISVKTITTSNHVSFRSSTFECVDRVMILRLSVEDDDIAIEEFLDCSTEDILSNYGKGKGDHFHVPVKKSGVSGDGATGHRIPVEELQELLKTGVAEYEKHRILQYENGSILVETDGEIVPVAKPTLREIAKAVGMDFLNSAGKPKNTRTLGADIIKVLQ